MRSSVNEFGNKIRPEVLVVISIKMVVKARTVEEISKEQSADRDKKRTKD
jgi:hypothetical protein